MPGIKNCVLEKERCNARSLYSECHRLRQNGYGWLLGPKWPPDPSKTGSKTNFGAIFDPV
eukprot:5140422-Karenia_brevis.AAC.1